MGFRNKLAIIGGGNLGTAIAEGVIASGMLPAEQIVITKRNIQTLTPLAHKGILISDNNIAATTDSEWIILAVKPFQILDVIRQINPYLTDQHKIVSVVTGISLADIEQELAVTIPIYRAMPNTAIGIRESVTCIAYESTDKQATEFIVNLFEQLGKAVIIDEKHMNAATVLGACGIAYAMRFIRANIQGGIEIGFDAKTAALIVEQTVKGAAALLLENGLHPEQEIDKVTTPKGCTITGLNEMEHNGFSSSLIKGIMASYDKI